jgi:UDP-GlcNAc:undecaprenyl-phosphate/decaprenyl-phosphate GlcNAc-1-phosphate transferase
MPLLIDRLVFRIVALIVGLGLALPWNIHGGTWLTGIKLVLASVLLTFGLMPLAIRLAALTHAVDKPSARRVHTEPTPRLGGVAILLSVNLTLLLNFNFSLELKGVCISALIVALISLLDDVRKLSAGVKLVGQLLAVAVLISSGVHVEMAPDVWWGNLIETVITALWVIGIANAFNFLDGINGLAAALAAATCALLALLAWDNHKLYMLMICLAVMGSALGFLIDNARYARPARSFMGDVGSIYLGWMMAALTVMGDWSSEGPLKAYSAPLLIFSVMIFDMIHTTVGRIARGDVKSFRQWIEHTGRDHLHHRLMDMGISQPHAVLIIVTFSLMMGLSALALLHVTRFGVGLLLAQAVVFYGVLTVLMLQRP